MNYARMFMKRAAILVPILALAGCGGGSPAAHPVSASQVIRAFHDHQLEAGKPTTMSPGDYGLAPYVGHGIHFLTPSVCPDCGGRVFTGSVDDLQHLNDYYVKLGKASAILYSWVAFNKRQGVLVQMNGDMPHAEWGGYQAVVDGLR